MISLRGNLSLAFNDFACLRGFAQIGDLAACSAIDKSYQRKAISEHVGDIVKFLRSGKYAFFSEIILGVSVESLDKRLDGIVDAGQSENIYRQFKNAISQGGVERIKGFRHKFKGGAVLSVYEKRFSATNSRTYDEINIYKQDPVSYFTAVIHGVDLYGKGNPLVRIDGNHRLEAASDEMVAEGRSVVVPYCLIFFETEEQCRENGAILFHNINYHAEKIPDSKNDNLILCMKRLDGEYLISDEDLKSGSSFGNGSYYYARIVLVRLIEKYGKDLAGLRLFNCVDDKLRIEVCGSLLVAIFKKMLVLRGYGQGFNRRRKVL